jgi:hypothetical protein
VCSGRRQAHRQRPEAQLWPAQWKCCPPCPRPRHPDRCTAPRPDAQAQRRAQAKAEGRPRARARPAPSVASRPSARPIRPSAGTCAPLALAAACRPAAERATEAKAITPRRVAARLRARRAHADRRTARRCWPALPGAASLTGAEHHMASWRGGRGAGDGAGSRTGAERSRLVAVKIFRAEAGGRRRRAGRLGVGNTGTCLLVPGVKLDFLGGSAGRRPAGPWDSPVQSNQAHN